MTNVELRDYSIKKRVKHYEIAERLGIQESSYSRMLRKELSEEKKERIKQIIDEIAG